MSARKLIQIRLVQKNLMSSFQNQHRVVFVFVFVFVFCLLRLSSLFLSFHLVRFAQKFIPDIFLTFSLYFHLLALPSFLSLRTHTLIFPDPNMLTLVLEMSKYGDKYKKKGKRLFPWTSSLALVWRFAFFSYSLPNSWLHS